MLRAIMLNDVMLSIVATIRQLCMKITILAAKDVYYSVKIMFKKGTNKQ
jgi:hypothetical protein